MTKKYSVSPAYTRQACLAKLGPYIYMIGGTDIFQDLTPYNLVEVFDTRDFTIFSMPPLTVATDEGVRFLSLILPYFQPPLLCRVALAFPARASITSAGSGAPSPPI